MGKVEVLNSVVRLANGICGLDSIKELRLVKLPRRYLGV